jgi:hypothetical protein
MHLAYLPCRKQASCLWLVYLTWTTRHFQSRYAKKTEETVRSTPVPEGTATEINALLGTIGSCCYCISLYDVSEHPKMSASSDWTGKQSKLLADLIDVFHVMVGRGGLEPPTSRLSGVRSNHLSYRPILVGP